MKDEQNDILDKFKNWVNILVITLFVISLVTFALLFGSLIMGMFVHSEFFFDRSNELLTLFISSISALLIYYTISEQVKANQIQINNNNKYWDTLSQQNAEQINEKRFLRVYGKIDDISELCKSFTFNYSEFPHEMLEDEKLTIDEIYKNRIQGGGERVLSGFEAFSEFGLIYNTKALEEYSNHNIEASTNFYNLILSLCDIAEIYDTFDEEDKKDIRIRIHLKIGPFIEELDTLFSMCLETHQKEPNKSQRHFIDILEEIEFLYEHDIFYV